MKIHVFSDPGHGWGKVKKSLLFDLGIAEKITSYSYQLGMYAYLEEDCDLTLLCNAVRESGQTVEFVEHFTNNNSAIRSYQHYRPIPFPRNPEIGDVVKLSVASPDALRITRKKPLEGRDKLGNLFSVPKTLVLEILADWPAVPRENPVVTLNDGV